MKFTLSWLKDHLDTDADAATVAETLTRIGLEVESVTDRAAALAPFTVARVVSAEKHPNADKLKLCMVETGSGTVQVVCGAPNAHAGMKGVFAAPGTVIPATGETLKVSAIRGVESRGMLCSERELELSGEHEGIIELSPDARVGTPAAAALGLDDPVFEIALTPNRGDCTSVFGIARDLAAAGLGKLRDGAVAKVAGTFASPLKIALDFPRGAERACPMFAGRLVRGVKNGESPAWLRRRLTAIGLRPISALVDVTNFVAYDRGRPLHVFDAAKLSGDMQARFAKDGETLVALDGRTYTLDSDMVVIADAKAARGVGGVMGGEETGCTAATTDVFIESALFDPVRIAATGRKLGIQSDARYRFERGVDPEFVLDGLELATRLILEFCGGEASEIVAAGKPPDWRREIALAPSFVRRLAGLDLPPAGIARILTGLGFTVKKGDPMKVLPPSWRGDIAGQADLVEEVVRIHGLDKVASAPMTRPNAVARPILTQAQRRVRAARRALAARGFVETVNNSFLPRAHARLFGGGDDARQLENPISAELDAMRPSVLPSLLAAAARNGARGVSHLLMFEIGPEFASGMPGAQRTVAAGIRVGMPPRHWTKTGHSPQAFDARADLEAALEAAWGQLPALVPAPRAPGWYHPGRSGTLALGPKAVLGHFGELHPKVARAFELDGPVAAFELYLDAIPEPKAKSAKARPPFVPAPFQAVERDFAFVVARDTPAAEIVRAAQSAERALIERIDVFDVYEGKGVPEGRKSVAISVRLQPRDRTLTDAEIEAVAAKIVAAVAKAAGGTLRT